MNEIEKARCRSTVYQALALGFSPPTAEVLKKVASAGGRSKIAQQLAEIGFPGELDFRIREGSLAERYHQLFGRSGSGGVWPYQTRFPSEALSSASNAPVDLEAFVIERELDVAPLRRERADHVSTQCEFMSLLGEREAVALEKGDRQLVEKIRNAQTAFLKSYLGQFAPTLGAQLERLDPGDFYGELGGLLKRFVEAEWARLMPAGGQTSKTEPGDAIFTGPEGEGAPAESAHLPR